MNMDKLLIINEIIKYYGYKKDSEFANRLGISSQVLTNWKSRNTYDAELIYTKCLDINPEWLLTGKGSMLKEGKPLEKAIKRNLIPLYNDVATIGGINSLIASNDSVSHTTEYIDAGDWFPGATAAIRHYGDSMPEYPSGSILALKKVEDLRLLIWGRNYCVETTEYRVTKRLNTSKKTEYITGYSSNKEVYPNGCLIHEPIEIPTELIRTIYQVLGCVTKEYSNGVVEINK
jgi:hypothetical protein